MTMKGKNYYRLGREFFIRDVLEVAPELPGKVIVIKRADGKYSSYRITDVEAYRGSDDLACHASRGRTKRTEIMYHQGGHLYVFLIYGMYWMLNIVTGQENEPQAVLIRGVSGVDGPGRVAREMGISGEWYGIDLTSQDTIFLEDSGERVPLSTSPRIGIDFAGEPWVSKQWRFYIPVVL